MSMQVNTSQLTSLNSALIVIAPEMVRKIEPIVKKGAQNIKNAMQADARKSRHFKQIAASVTYDVNPIGTAPDGGFEAEIGYDKDADPAAALAGIAIFGSSKPGGGTVRNPEEALNDEASAFEAQLAALANVVI